MAVGYYNWSWDDSRWKFTGYFEVTYTIDFANSVIHCQLTRHDIIRDYDYGGGAAHDDGIYFMAGNAWYDSGMVNGGLNTGYDPTPIKPTGVGIIWQAWVKRRPWTVNTGNSPWHPSWDVYYDPTDASRNGVKIAGGGTCRFGWTWHAYDYRQDVVVLVPSHEFSYRPGQRKVGGTWYSHNRNGGWTNRIGYGEMRTRGGDANMTDKPPSIKRGSTWYNQKKIGSGG